MATAQYCLIYCLDHSFSWLYKCIYLLTKLQLLASCLIYAKPFWRGNPAPISVLIWVRSFTEPDVLKTKVPFDNTAEIYLINLHWKLGLGFKLRLSVALFSIFTENKKSEHLIFREFHGR